MLVTMECFNIRSADGVTPTLATVDSSDNHQSLPVSKNNPATPQNISAARLRFMSAATRLHFISGGMHTETHGPRSMAHDHEKREHSMR